MDNRPQFRKSNQYPDDVPWTIINQSTDETKIRLGLKSKEEFQSWLTHYQSKCGYIYRVLRHRKSDGKYAVFKATYRCQHNTVPSHHKAKKPSTKHTNCPAKIEVTIKAVHKRSRGLDNYMPDYPAIVRIIGIHNHRSNAQEALKHKDVPDHVRSKFLELFKAGHGPAQALKLHKSDLMTEYGEDYNQFVSDRAVCPDSKWVYYVYNRDFKRLHNQLYPKDATVKEIELEIKNLQSQGVRILMKTGNGESYCIAMCTPMMDRIHLLETSGPVALIDSSGNIDRYNRHVFMIMVDSCLGGLPVGAMIVSNLSEESFIQVCKLYCMVMPENAFGGRGVLGPSVILCDNILLQKEAVKECFPDSLIALCPSIVLHQDWRWLWHSKHNIESLDKREIFRLFSHLFTHSTELEFQKYYDTLITSDIIQKYPKLVKYISEKRLKNDIWSTSWITNSIPLNSANSFNDISKRLIKDKILEKTKSFSMLKMVKYIESDLMVFYKNRIMSAVSDDAEQYFYDQYNIEKQLLLEFDIVKQNDFYHEVRRLDNAEEVYQVSILCGVCDCSMGRINSSCGHQLAVAAKEDIVETQLLPIDNDSKKHLYWLATGEHDDCAEKSKPCFLKKETRSMSIDDDTFEKATTEKDEDFEKMIEEYPKSEIQKIGQEFINTIMKFYYPNPKELVLAMRKFQLNVDQKFTNAHDVISFLNSNLVGENHLEDTVSNTIVVDHDYSYQMQEKV